MPSIEALQNIPQTVMDVYEPAAPDIQEKLYPTLEAVGRIYKGVLGVLDKNGIKEEQILTYLDTPGLYSPRQHISVEGRDLHRLANQYEHVRKVMGTTMELKRRLLEKGLLDRIVAYQSGTGWPKPEENEDCKEVDFIPYGEGPLAEFSPPGTKGDKEAGIHVYQVKGKDGREITLLAIMRRAHAYTETDWETAAHDLAFMPRVLKGIGAEFILSTFASGADKHVVGDSVKKHDLGVIVSASDESGLSNQMGPGTGDTRIISQVFGGPFRNLAAMIPNVEDTQMLMDAVRAVNEMDSPESPIRPNIVPAVQVDTRSTPNFQGPFEQASAQVVFDRILVNNTLPRIIMDLFPGIVPALVHGMVQAEERGAYFESWDKAIASPFNRRLRELAVETFTDMLDLSPKGQSYEISDDEVKRSAKEAEFIMARIITTFFERYINRPTSVLG